MFGRESWAKNRWTSLFRRFFVRYVLLRHGMLSDAVDSGVNGIPRARVESKQGGRGWWNVQQLNFHSVPFTTRRLFQFDVREYATAKRNDFIY